ncbi:MAG TPA: CpaF family protein [Alphaproteobacteria bacterium]
MFGRRTSEAAPPLRLVEPGAAANNGPGTSAQSASAAAASPWVLESKDRLAPVVRNLVPPAEAKRLTRVELSDLVQSVVKSFIEENGAKPSPADERGLVAALTNEVQKPSTNEISLGPLPHTQEPVAVAPTPRSPIDIAKEHIQPKLLSRVDIAAASALPRDELGRQLGEIVAEIIFEEKMQLNALEQRDLVTKLLNDMLGLGPLEPLLADESITDILINGPQQVYIERAGKLELSGVRFRDDSHVMNIATRIVSRIGRRIDESNPLCDARLLDGSRVNIIIPPLAIDGPSVSIRKFSKKKITLDVMMRQGNISPQMATVLKIGGRSRLNILISGGTGSGKTTLLNAISQMIDSGERIVTIEDAAELQLQQPHVVRLETRPANIEGQGEITMRELVKNSLRMRPDRIILGEVRGSEAVDMLQAMNTGHEGSLGTIHANRPREALTRLENMVGMAGINLPSKAIRTQIAAALDMIVQVSRMRDGVRRITHIMEVVGMEGDVITTQDLFHYEVEGEGPDGKLIGRYKSSGLRPHFTPKAAYFGLDKPLIEAVA